MTDSQLLDLAFDLARAAGDLILAKRAEGFATHRKADASVVTEADHAAEALIVEALRDASHAPVVAEEEIAAGHVPECRELFWLVDPLDGTRDFAAGGDDFAVCIGLVRDLKPVLGVVGVPAENAVYGGLVGGGAERRGTGSTTAITARRPPDDGMIVVASRRSAEDRRMRPYLAERRVADIRYMSSAMKFCRIAEGAADLYPRFGRTMEWDTAGAQALLEAAGGSVRCIENGSALSYGKPGWENPAFVGSGLVDRKTRAGDAP